MKKVIVLKGITLLIVVLLIAFPFMSVMIYFFLNQLQDSEPDWIVSLQKFLLSTDKLIVSLPLGLLEALPGYFYLIVHDKLQVGDDQRKDMTPFEIAFLIVLAIGIILAILNILLYDVEDHSDKLYGGPEIIVKFIETSKIVLRISLIYIGVIFGFKKANDR